MVMMKVNKKQMKNCDAVRDKPARLDKSIRTAEVLTKSVLHLQVDNNIKYCDLYQDLRYIGEDLCQGECCRSIHRPRYQ